jgi:hypothetical protein
MRLSARGYAALNSLLRPDIAELEARINHMLLPRLGEAPDIYVELNLQQKLAGSFEEQAQVFSTSIGRPWMTANEGRARLNLPSIPGGDELVTPLNVLVGGQASPRDSGSQNLRGQQAETKQRVETFSSDAGGVRVKADPDDAEVEEAAAVLRRFYKRQRAAVLSRLGAKAGADWWNELRWNEELAKDLLAFSLKTVEQTAHEMLGALGLPVTVFNLERARKFLEAVAASRAKAINTITKRQLDAALAARGSSENSGTDPVRHVFAIAETSRAKEGALTFVTTLTGFALTETGRQLPNRRVTKTWIVTSGNPRASHASLSGETVPAGSEFSNGMQWPGDISVGDPDEICGCRCTVEVNVE